MKMRLFPFAAACFLLAGAVVVRAAAPALPPPVMPQDLVPLSRLRDAQGMALAQGKVVGFLLTWPKYFPGAPDFHRNSSVSSSYFYQGFKDKAVLVNVDHAASNLDQLLPKVAADAFHSPAEGGYAPCLCLTDARFTRLIGMIPLWNDPAEREKFFRQYHEVIADPTRWGEAARPTAATAAAPSAPAVAAAAAAPAMPAPRPAAVQTPAPVSSGFAREMELTRQAEQQQKAAPSP